MTAPNPVTRFAPSPTGYLHLGHAYSALVARDRAADGRFLLRIEDIDRGRCRGEYEAAILEDLEWLGLSWETPVRRQSEHMGDYADAIERLKGLGVLYPCFCTRRDIAREIEAAGHAPQGPDGPVYPGTCRAMAAAERNRKMDEGWAFALRLDMELARSKSSALDWVSVDDAGNRDTVRATPEIFGDVVLARKDVPTSYHLACTLDDHLQGITLVTRGADLFRATHVHRLIQALLGLDTPDYHHHRMLRDSVGTRLAKRDGAMAIRALRGQGKSAADVKKMTGIEG